MFAAILGNTGRRSGPSKRRLGRLLAMTLAAGAMLLPPRLADASSNTDCIWGLYSGTYRVCLYMPAGGCVACIVIVEG